MPEKPPPENEFDDWKAAERALAEARGLQGSQRFEALKRAGQLRYDAHKKHHYDFIHAKKIEMLEAIARQK